MVGFLTGQETNYDLASVAAVKIQIFKHLRHCNRSVFLRAGRTPELVFTPTLSLPLAKLSL